MKFESIEYFGYAADTGDVNIVPLDESLASFSINCPLLKTYTIFVPSGEYVGISPITDVIADQSDTSPDSFL